MQESQTSGTNFNLFVDHEWQWVYLTEIPLVRMSAKRRNWQPERGADHSDQKVKPVSTSGTVKSRWTKGGLAENE